VANQKLIYIRHFFLQKNHRFVELMGNVQNRGSPKKTSAVPINNGRERVCLYEYDYVGICAFVYICMHVCMCRIEVRLKRLPQCLSTMCVCMCICMYVRMHVCKYVYMYVLCVHNRGSPKKTSAVPINNGRERVCMCVCVYVFRHVHMCVCMYVCICAFVYMCMYVYMYVCMYVQNPSSPQKTSAVPINNGRERVCMCVYVCMYVCVYVCMYVYIYIYICICICAESKFASKYFRSVYQQW
jgi:hypothetical protein